MLIKINYPESYVFSTSSVKSNNNNIKIIPVYSAPHHIQPNSNKSYNEKIKSKYNYKLNAFGLTNCLNCFICITKLMTQSGLIKSSLFWPPMNLWSRGSVEILLILTLTLFLFDILILFFMVFLFFLENYILCVTK